MEGEFIEVRVEWRRVLPARRSSTAPYFALLAVQRACGSRICVTPWPPPATYKTNGSITCSTTAPLSSGDNGAYATWLANLVKSLQADSINLYAMSVQNKLDTCRDYDSATWTVAEL